MDLIETVFENWDVAHSAWRDRVLLKKTSAYWQTEADAVMRAILKNIIKNKGTFRLKKSDLNPSAL